jgi:hypothetical protein
MVSPVTVAHQTIKYEYAAIQMMLPRNVKMKYLRPAAIKRINEVHFIYGHGKTNRKC